VINTEAHPLPRFKPGPLFETGWKRKPRGADGKILPDPPKEEKPNEEKDKAKAVEETKSTAT
jgi:hypothetical protein